MNEQITTGSIFDDLNLDPGKAEQMKIKAVFFDSIIAFIKKINSLRNKRRSLWASNAPG